MDKKKRRQVELGTIFVSVAAVLAIIAGGRGVMSTPEGFIWSIGTAFLASLGVIILVIAATQR